MAMDAGFPGTGLNFLPQAARTSRFRAFLARLRQPARDATIKVAQSSGPVVLLTVQVACPARKALENPSCHSS